MNKVFTRNIDVFPYTGVREVEGYLKLSTKEFLKHYFDGTKKYEQVKNATRGKIYKVVKAVGYGDVEDFVIIGDNGDELTLGSFFFEELTEEEYKNVLNNSKQKVKKRILEKEK
mgnify:CR=1 FL=1